MLMELSAACCRHHARCNKHQWDPDPHRTTGRWPLPPLAVLLSAPAVGLVPAALMLLYTFRPCLPPRRRHGAARWKHRAGREVSASL